MEPHGAIYVPWSDVVAVFGTAWPFVLGAVLALVMWIVLHVKGRAGR